MTTWFGTRAERIGGLAALVPLVTAATVTLYAAGFLIVSAHLASFGVVNVEPLRARYVASAIPFLGLAALAVVVTDQVVAIARRRVPAAGRSWMSLAIAGGLVVGSALSSVLISVVLRTVGGTGPAASLATLGEYGFFAFGAVIVIGSIRQAAARVGTERVDVVSLVGSLTFFVLMIGTYTASIYPALPVWIGGGEVTQVHVLFEHPLTDLCGECTDEFRLIDEDPTRFILLAALASGPRAIEVARANVRAVLYPVQRGIGNPPP